MLIIERSGTVLVWGRGERGGDKMCVCGEDLAEEFVDTENIKVLFQRGTKNSFKLNVLPPLLILLVCL